MKIRLYTLPLVSLAYPNLSVPTLLGYLKDRFQIDQKDLSISITNLLTHENLLAEYTNLRENITNIEKEYLDSILNIENSLNIIRNKDLFNFPDYIKATKTINDCLELLSYKFGCSWNLTKFSFLRKPNSVNELLKFVDELSLFDTIFDDEVKLLNNDKRDIIGLSVSYAEQLPFALRFSQKLKEKFPNVKVIFGGSYITHAAANIKSIMDDSELIDVAVLFNGELVLEQIINSYKNFGKVTSDIPNVFYRDKGRVKNNFFKKNHGCVNDIIPSYDGINLDKYLSPERVLPVMLSSGCKHGKCSFCSHHYNHGKFNGFKKNQTIIDEFKCITQKYKTKNIYFVDAYLTIEKLMEVASLIKFNDIKIKWMTETRIDPLLSEKEIVGEIKKSGCVLLSFGIESYNRSTLKSMYKEINVDCIPQVMDTLANHNITTCITLITGYPGETIKQMEHSLNQAFSNEDIDLVGVSAFGLMENSPMHLLPQKWGLSHLKKKDFLSLEYNFKFKDVEYNQSNIFNLINSITKENNLQIFRDVQRIIQNRVHFFFITKKQLQEIKRISKGMISR
ncbi:B12-binding domain-containing radical SAM protein [Niallia sp. Marseille-Q9988]